MLDIFFLSYMETNAEQNWQSLTSRFPSAQRVHGIKGVKNAHCAIARLAHTDFFFVVDGDNILLESFQFEPPANIDKETLYVWRALNPVNNLCYGFGGVKLYNKWLLLENIKTSSVDIATSIAPKYNPVSERASVTQFNSSALESWRGAFREACKLTINTIQRPSDVWSSSRLTTWMSLGADKPFGKDCLLGAKMGHEYALKHLASPLDLAKINDFEWLNSLFASRDSKY